MASRRPDVVVWGAGMSASVHVDACRSLGWPVRAIASRPSDRARALARSAGARVVSFDDVVAARLGDLAIVATPPATHVDAAISLLAAGYHVVVEAPLACTLDDADRLLAAEGRHDRSVLYSEHLVSAPAVDVLLTEVAGLGHLTHLSARALQPAPDWRATSEADWGGGALFDLGVHPVGIVLRLAAEGGAGRPRSVGAVVTDAGTAREHANVVVHFDSGLSASVVVGWSPGRLPDWDVQASSAGGVLRVELFPSPTLERNGDPVRVPGAAREPSLVRDYGYAAQLARYWATLRTGRPAPVTSRLGRLVLEVIAAAHWSAGHAAREVALPFAGPTDRTPLELLAAG